MLTKEQQESIDHMIFCIYCGENVEYGRGWKSIGLCKKHSLMWREDIKIGLFYRNRLKMIQELIDQNIESNMIEKYIELMDLYTDSKTEKEGDAIYRRVCIELPPDQQLSFRRYWGIAEFEGRRTGKMPVNWIRVHHEVNNPEQLVLFK